MAEPSTREYRRFTAVMLVHPALQTSTDIRELLPDSVVRSAALKNLPHGWDGVRAEYLQPRRSFYPERLINKDSRQRGNAGFAHDIYIASKDLGGAAGRVTFVASPYVMLLTRLVDEILDQIGEPGMQYIDVVMPSVYRWLDQDEKISSQVNRVMMQIVGEPYADLVSLSGKRPLHSAVHEKLKSVTVPYGVGVRVNRDGVDCRVSIDRHGVIHWFQTKEEYIAHPMTLIDQINAAGAFQTSRRSPLLRESKDKRVEREEW